MTAKQKAARAKFKKAIAEAKKLRAKNPRLSQAQAVKQAWAILYSQERKKPAVKKAARKVAGVKKKAAKKKVVKKSDNIHKDTKSHNVNIRVVSGLGAVNDQTIRQWHDAASKLISWEKLLKQLENQKQKTTGVEKTMLLIDIKRVKSAIKEQKTHIRELKKHIK